MRKCIRPVFSVVLVLFAVFFLAGCGKPAKPEAMLPVDQLAGVWKNIEFGKKPVLIFNKNDTYTLKFLIGNLDYNGNYHVSGDMFHFLDYYCGTGVPGIYRFSVKGDDLSLVCVDDAVCDRHKFFTQKWKRVKKP